MKQSGVSDLEDKSEGKRESRVHFAEIAENEVNVSDIPTKRTRMNEFKDPNLLKPLKKQIVKLIQGLGLLWVLMLIHS